MVFTVFAMKNMKEQSFFFLLDVFFFEALS